MAIAVRDIITHPARGTGGDAAAPGAARGAPALAETPVDALLPVHALSCRLRVTPAAATCSAILAGLSMLERAGRIRLELDVVPDATPLAHGPWHLRDKQRPQPVLEIDGGGSAVIDPHDSWELEEDDLARHDLYFKRSLIPALLHRPGGEKLRALPLLNDVRNDFLDRHELRAEVAAGGSRAGRLRALLRWQARWVAARGFDLGSRPNWSRMHAPPVPGQPARVLLRAGLWDPAAVPAWEREKRAEFEQLNRQRIECVRALRREFGARFTGGLVPTPFARHVAPDALLPAGQRGSHREFLRAVREHPVCVTSMGLHGSNGWRLAEFVSFSRAIVSEPLQYSVSGELHAGTHFLEFTTPGECVARVAQLLANREEREAMARCNWDYYQRSQRPDQLALRIVALTWAAARRARHAAAAG